MKARNVGAVSMTKAEWDMLIAAGIPLAGEHEAPGQSVDFSALRHVILNVLASGPEPKIRDAIRGWLIAMRDHFPTRFARHSHGPELAKLIEAPVTGRDIKLRRIALNHLGKIS
jgi:hypothetical protein